jgi:hypothetical protein
MHLFESLPLRLSKRQYLDPIRVTMVVSDPEWTLWALAPRAGVRGIGKHQKISLYKPRSCSPRSFPISQRKVWF